MATETRLLFYVLFFIYLIITVFCLFRLWKIHSFAKDNRLAKFFYVSIFVQNLFNALALLFLAIFMPTIQNEIDNEDESA